MLLPSLLIVQVDEQLEAAPANVFMLHMSRPNCSDDFGESAARGFLRRVGRFLLLRTTSPLITSISAPPSPPGFAVTGHIDGQKNSRIFVSEVLPDGLAFAAGLRPGDEILVLNGRCVSHLNLALTQTLFAEQTLHLSLRRDGAPPPPAAAAAATSLAPPPPPSSSPLNLQQEVRSKHHRAKSSSGASFF